VDAGEKSSRFCMLYDASMPESEASVLESLRSVAISTLPSLSTTEDERLRELLGSFLLRTGVIRLPTDVFLLCAVAVEGSEEPFRWVVVLPSSPGAVSMSLNEGIVTIRG